MCWSKKGRTDSNFGTGGLFFDQGPASHAFEGHEEIQNLLAAGEDAAISAVSEEVSKKSARPV